VAHGKYGWLPDKHPHLDKRIGHLLGAAPPPPPSDLRDKYALAPAYDQARNDCTANGLARMLQILHSSVGGTAPGPMFARNFIYYESGVPDGLQLQDEGRYPSSAVEAVNALGCCVEDLWPYNDQWNQRPRGDQYRGAYDFKLGQYRIDTGAAFQDGAMRALAAGLPIGLGSGVSQAWEDQSGLQPFDGDPNEPDIGGHFYVAIAADLMGLKFINSWAPDWGSNGCGWLSWNWCAAKITDAIVCTLESP
jgi:hypothetical protein